MKNNVKKFSLIFGLVVCFAAVMLGIFLLNSNKNTPLSVTVFYSETGEYTPGFNGGEIAIFNGSEKIETITQNNKLTLSNTLENPENLTIQATPNTGFGFAGFYSSANFSGDSLLSNNPNFAPPKNTKVFAKFGSLVNVTFNVTTENANLSQQITTQQPLTKHMQNSDFLAVVNQNCTPEITAFYNGKTAQLTQNLGTGLNTFQITTTAQTLTLQPAEIDSVGDGVIDAITKMFFTIVYNGNGATSGSMANQSVSTAASTQQRYFTSNSYAKTGHTFLGWSKSSTATSATYTNGQTIPSGFASGGTTVTLYAVWQVNTYTVVYNGNSSTSGSTASSTHTYNTAKALTANGFSRTGYTFQGWDTSSAGTTVKYTNQQSVTNLSTTQGATVNLYAVWQVHTYTVKYNGNNATSGSTANSSHTYDLAKALTANGFSRTGYTFIGWDTSSAGTTVKYTNSQSVSNLTATNGATYNLYAVWQVHTYTVVYNANGGLGSMSNSAYTYDVSKPLTANSFTKLGYTFLGWSRSSEANSVEYVDQQSVKNLTATNNGTVTLYAVWGYTYTVAYNGNGATSGSTATSVHTYNLSANLTTNGFLRTGYTFLGWSTSSAATTATYADGQEVCNLATSPYETVILYAVWQGNSYTVHYDANGGSGSMEDSSHVYGTESKLRENTFTKEGYVFLGWNENQNATIETYNDKEKISTLTTTANATVTLYATWLKKDITVTVDPNGGVYNGVETATVYNCSVGSDLVLGVPSRQGYEFTEFNTQGDGLGQTLNGTMVLNGDVTFYALWQPLNYVIKYFDGDLYLGQTEVWYNENLSLPRWETLLSNNSLTGGKFKQYGWNFAGWTADTNGTQIEHTNGGAVMNLAEAGTTINLYAMHTQTLNLTYNGNGSTSGNVASQSSDLMLNSKSEKLANFVIKLANNSYAKTNYSFKNWAIGSSSGTQKSAGANITNVDLKLTYSSSFNKTIYAIWQGNTYSINYYNGTENIATENYVYGNASVLKNFSTIGEVLNLAYGWEFYGWATANNTFTRVFVDGANITNISVENGAEITQNMVINLYSIYVRTITFVSGLHTEPTTTTATQFWNAYSTENSNLSSVLAEAPQTIETGNWIALGYRTDITAGTATFALITTTEIRPAVNTFNTLYAVYSRTITIADLNTTTTATQYYNSVGTVSTVGQ